MANLSIKFDRVLDRLEPVVNNMYKFFATASFGQTLSGTTQERLSKLLFCLFIIFCFLHPITFCYTAFIYRICQDKAVCSGVLPR